MPPRAGSQPSFCSEISSSPSCPCLLHEQLLRHELPELMSLIIDQRAEDRAPHLTSPVKVEGQREASRWRKQGLGLTPDTAADSASSGAMVRAVLGPGTVLLWPHSAYLVALSLSVPTCDVGESSQRRPYCSQSILEINTPERPRERQGRGQWRGHCW